jgi:lysine decarboxylase
VTAYGFRDSVRFHAPGPQGWECADPGLRSALGDRALLLDVPLDIEGTRRSAPRSDHPRGGARPRRDQRDPRVRCSTLGPSFIGRPGIAGKDPLRIVVDVRGTGCTGYEVAAALRASYDMYVELATQATLVLVLVLGLGQPVDALERLAHDFAETVKRIARAGEETAVSRRPVALEHETVVAPRGAFLGPSEAVAVEDAIGRISCESIAGYPSGVPALLPGERVTAEVVDYLRELTVAGARLHGAADRTFATVRVLVQ